METVNVVSSQIKTIKYNDIDKELIVTFNTDKVYKYEDVSMKLFKDLISADSVGKFFNENIKKSHKYSLIS